VRFLRLLVGSLAAVGGVVVVAAIVFVSLRLIPLDGGPVVGSLPSPNGKLKAVWRQGAGGGTWSQSCQSDIYVAPASVPNEKVHLYSSYLVFGSDCDLFGDHNGSNIGSNIEWLSDTNLKIEFSTTSYAEAVTLRGRDVSQTVRISFSIRN
jgi:hypothetical protein